MTTAHAKPKVPINSIHVTPKAAAKVRGIGESASPHFWPAPGVDVKVIAPDAVYVDFRIDAAAATVVLKAYARVCAAQE